MRLKHYLKCSVFKIIVLELVSFEKHILSVTLLTAASKPITPFKSFLKPKLVFMYSLEFNAPQAGGTFTNFMSDFCFTHTVLRGFGMLNL